MAKFRIELTIDVTATSGEAARSTVQHRFYGPDYLSNLNIKRVEQLMSPMEKFAYWQEQFNLDTRFKTVENDDANQVFIVEYMDAAIEAQKSGDLPLETVHEVWTKVKKWWVV